MRVNPIAPKGIALAAQAAGRTVVAEVEVEVVLRRVVGVLVAVDLGTVVEAGVGESESGKPVVTLVALDAPASTAIRPPSPPESGSIRQTTAPAATTAKATDPTNHGRRRVESADPRRIPAVWAESGLGRLGQEQFVAISPI
jgi:hypothetical protein